ncbi:uncharacterized protein EURHEDRAFT_416063 [Aspergillus ruber CBS 135680]|uniref:Uncharacterized protein n=1 Tax=Aspergillus ruber (strain CBS 135680) TaxID=1388766 RepID=A0A017S2S9_ASPRC|nr:uncharacterized protein EURHEDRAFT_416707 [Aspergillus ruber CBS 135680]XP_040635481.1 uncharacterized protein EURHEDRAFT_416063 [Aspergillus ruber CBS 135680]EYE91257.1 hypothetical protein EURHEDRAFT_416707 [Aspergillus ruber CBS 135680]EYE91791.1 hypothetical protein EURHEDRAFT_416063 [Aspergillus ruber CBS 135680]
MARVKTNEAYKRYVELGKEKLYLPDFEVTSMGYLVPFVGEVYCRAEGCENVTKFISLNNLKKHIRTKHTHTYDLLDGESGGRPDQEAESAAVKFYEAVIKKFDAKQSAPALPPLPRRRDGEVHMTEMRRLVRRMGHVVPCESCKDAHKAKLCCKYEECEHFALFDSGDQGKSSEEEESNESEDED